MPHTAREKDKLIARVRRISGQIKAIETALDDEQEASSIMQLIASCRGALNGLMAELIEGHMNEHVADEKNVGKRKVAANELLEILKRTCGEYRLKRKETSWQDTNTMTEKDTATVTPASIHPSLHPIAASGR
jgi:DNA-binding FrmR family transcriptional regulator